MDRLRAAVRLRFNEGSPRPVAYPVRPFQPERLLGSSSPPSLQPADPRRPQLTAPIRLPSASPCSVLDSGPPNQENLPRYHACSTLTVCLSPGPHSLLLLAFSLLTCRARLLQYRWPSTCLLGCLTQTQTNLRPWNSGQAVLIRPAYGAAQVFSSEAVSPVPWPLPRVACGSVGCAAR